MGITKNQLKRELALVIANAVMQYGNTLHGAAADVVVDELNRDTVWVSAQMEDLSGTFNLKINVKETVRR